MMQTHVKHTVSPRCVSCVKSVTWCRQPHSRCWCWLLWSTPDWTTETACYDCFMWSLFVTRCIVRLCSTLYGVWLQLVTASIVSNCFTIFLLIFFNSTDHLLWLIAYLCDTITFSNIIVSFFVVFVDNRGITFIEYKVVARKYVIGMFIVDVLSIMPFDIMLVGMVDFKTLAWSRLNRLIGLIRVIVFLSKSTLCHGVTTTHYTLSNVRKYSNQEAGIARVTNPPCA